MSDESQTTNGLEGWMKGWFDFMGRMATAGSSVIAETPAPAAARQMREAFFRAMSSQAEDYMRSPEFLELMKTSMNNALAWRMQMNAFLRQAYRDTRMPSQDDIEDLAGRVQQLQKQVMDRIEGIERQLGALLKALRPGDDAPDPGPPVRKATRLVPGPSPARRKKHPPR